MRSTIPPYCSRLACRLVGVSAGLLVMLGGLRLLSAAETHVPAVAVEAATVEASPDTAWAAYAEPAPWTPSVRDVEAAVARAGITCGGPVCGFDRVEPFLAPAWHAAEAIDGRAAAATWTEGAPAAAGSPVPPVVAAPAMLLRPDSLRVAF